MTFLGWSSDPFKWLSDLQLGDEKVTLNHLAVVWFSNITFHRCFQDLSGSREKQLYRLDMMRGSVTDAVLELYVIYHIYNIYIIYIYMHVYKYVYIYTYLCMYVIIHGVLVVSVAPKKQLGHLRWILANGLHGIFEAHNHWTKTEVIQGGGFNPFEKYWSNWIISPSRINIFETTT